MNFFTHFAWVRATAKWFKSCAILHNHSWYWDWYSEVTLWCLSATAIAVWWAIMKFFHHKFRWPFSYLKKQTERLNSAINIPPYFIEMWTIKFYGPSMGFRFISELCISYICEENNGNRETKNVKMKKLVNIPLQFLWCVNLSNLTISE